MTIRLAALTLLATLAVTAAFAVGHGDTRDRLGVILLHGKLGTPTDRRSGLEAIGRELQAKGARVALPTMPWSAEGWLTIDDDVPAALAMLDAMAASLRAEGARRIVLVGHSLGANVALAYAANRGGVAGLVMAAPGHIPGALTRRDEAVRVAVERAREMVAAGRGNDRFVGPDGIQGSSLTLTTRAAVYLSWLDPEGLASMEVQARKIAPSLPLLMVISRHDPFYPQAETLIYHPAA